MASQAALKALPAAQGDPVPPLSTFEAAPGVLGPSVQGMWALWGEPSKGPRGAAGPGASLR